MKLRYLAGFGCLAISVLLCWIGLKPDISSLVGSTALSNELKKVSADDASVDNTSADALASASSISPTLTVSPTITPLTTLTPTTLTSTPSGSLTPSTLIPSRSAPACDPSCGVCGWRDVAGTCQALGPMPDGRACCYKTCLENACMTVSGYGVDMCTNAASCLSPTPAGLLGSVTQLPVTAITTGPTPIQTLPVTGDFHWVIYIVIPAAILALGLAL